MQNKSTEINVIIVTKTLTLHLIKEWNSFSVDVQSTPALKQTKQLTLSNGVRDYEPQWLGTLAY